MMMIQVTQAGAADGALRSVAGKPGITASHILISNGFSRFHMAVAAAEIERRGRLALLVTGAYPTRRATGLIAALGLQGHPRVERLLDRGEAVAEDRIRALWLSELIYNLGMRWRPLDRLSYRYYARAAIAAVRKAHHLGARLYHYRAGFGHESVREAKRLGMLTLCDHSIVHPSLLGDLIKEGGKFPAREHCRPMNAVWRDILEDIEQADHVLVNSHFVADTFAHVGWSRERLTVIYLGIDENFMKDIPIRSRSETRYDGPLRLLFAGGFGFRKGAHILLSALRQLQGHDWELRVAGSIDPEMETQYRDMRSSPRIKYLGALHRRRLPEAMSEADLFVFPSLAEGSARVVFEALACGLPVITTPNAGSIVEDGEHGWLVPPGDVDATAAALQSAINNRSGLPAMGEANARLVRECYTQTHYGDKLEALYDKLLGKA